MELAHRTVVRAWGVALSAAPWLTACGASSDFDSGSASVGGTSGLPTSETGGHPNSGGTNATGGTFGTRDSNPTGGTSQLVSGTVAKAGSAGIAGASGTSGGSVAVGSTTSPGGTSGSGSSSAPGTTQSSSSGGFQTIGSKSRTSTGGTSAGGARSTNTGGATGIGGAKAIGGAASTGGASAKGGSSATGGAVTTGGKPNSGGGPASGGIISAGGFAVTGGASPTGGAAAAGGLSTVGGARAVGGATAATGGVASTGGSLATGGVSSTGGTVAAGGAIATGGSLASGGALSTGGEPATGGGNASGGALSTGGEPATGGSIATGGVSSTGGTIAAGGTIATGGSLASGGALSTGGEPATGGSIASGGVSNTGGEPATGGETATGGSSGDNGCKITVSKNSTSSFIPTVGIVEWSTTATNLKSAQIVYTLDNATSSILNSGGTAPVDLTATNYHTLLLGLKPSSTYTFHIEATLSDNSVCKGSDYTLMTGTLSGVPSVTRSSSNPSAQAKGFIITSTDDGNGAASAFIIDADGEIVWSATAPASCTRARMDYEGVNMWMIAMNVMNNGGEMRYVSMDGASTENNVSGLSSAHHDFTVLPGGVVAALAWASSGIEVESNLLERSATGTITTDFRIGANLYMGGPSSLGGSGTDTYHCNSIHYYPSNDTFTISDRNPSLYVEVTHAGAPVWQFGGSCTNAPAPLCEPGSWVSNHGHHLLDTGDFLFFSNSAMRSSNPSHAFEYMLDTSSSSMTARELADYTSNDYHSDTLGDVQRLPNGNTLVTFSNNGIIQEVDASWSIVQTLSANSFGYADWRETLYGPPPR